MNACISIVKGTRLHLVIRVVRVQLTRDQPRVIGSLEKENDEVK